MGRRGTRETRTGGGAAQPLARVDSRAWGQPGAPSGAPEGWWLPTKVVAEPGAAAFNGDSGAR